MPILRRFILFLIYLVAFVISYNNPPTAFAILAILLAIYSISFPQYFSQSDKIRYTIISYFSNDIVALFLLFFAMPAYRFYEDTSLTLLLALFAGFGFYIALIAAWYESLSVEITDDAIVVKSFKGTVSYLYSDIKYFTLIEILKNKTVDLILDTHSVFSVADLFSGSNYSNFIMSHYNDNQTQLSVKIYLKNGDSFIFTPYTIKNKTALINYDKILDALKNHKILLSSKIEAHTPSIVDLDFLVGKLVSGKLIIAFLLFFPISIILATYFKPVLYNLTKYNSNDRYAHNADSNFLKYKAKYNFVYLNSNSYIIDSVPNHRTIDFIFESSFAQKSLVYATYIDNSYYILYKDKNTRLSSDSKNDKDFILCKFDNNGKHNWTARFGSEYDEASAIIKPYNNNALLIAGINYKSSKGYTKGNLFFARISNSGEIISTNTIESSSNYSYSKVLDFNLQKSGNLKFAIATKYSSVNSFPSDGSNKSLQDTTTFITTDIDAKIYTAKYTQKLRNLKFSGDRGYVCSVNKDKDIIISKYSDFNQLSWRTEIKGEKNDICDFLNICSDNSILIVGYTESYGQGTSLVASISPNGNLLWSKGFGNSAYRALDCIELDSKYYILSNNTKYSADESGISKFQIVKIDKSGNELSKSTIQSKEFNSISANICKSELNTFTVFGTKIYEADDYNKLYYTFLLKMKK